MPKHNELHDIESLIVMVKNRSAIYDYSCTEHKNKEYIDSLWKEIADALNMTTSLCKSKWLALRNSYSREIRNEKRAKAYGRKRKRTWYLAEDMAFLREYLNYGQQNRGSINEGQIESEDDNTNFDDETSTSSIRIAEVKTICIPKEEIVVELQSIPSETTAFETVKRSPISTPAENTIEDPLIQCSYTNTKRQEEITELQEQNLTFFRSILPDILKLSERRQRLFKQDVLSVLNRALDEQEMGS